MFLSVFDVFKIGIGPSSSHTMGPMLAAARFIDDLRAGRGKYPGCGPLSRVTATLHGSLAFTGKGHATDRAVILGLCGQRPATLDPDEAERIEQAVYADRKITPDDLPVLDFDPASDLVFDYGPPLEGHANGMVLRGHDKDGNLYYAQTYYSVGGGFILTDEELAKAGDGTSLADDKQAAQFPFPFGTAREMLEMGRASGKTIAEMKRANERTIHGAALSSKLDEILRAMDDCIDRGLAQDGILPGGLKVRRRAKRSTNPCWPNRA